MALEGGVPVIPVVMVGTDKAQPIGRKLPRITRIGVRIGTPLDFSRYEGLEGDRFVLRSITDEIMYELMQLGGQEYVDVYAASMKERLAAAKRGKTVALPGDPEDEDDTPATAADGDLDGDLAVDLDGGPAVNLEDDLDGESAAVADDADADADERDPGTGERAAG
jgi:1-acyl-sn-glycerol-3-phosphate acyltransferase